MTITNSKRDEPQTVTLSMKEGMMKVDLATERGAVTTVMDVKNHQMTMMMHDQKMFMVLPLRADAQQHVQKDLNKDFSPDVQVTTTRDTILGYDCTKIIATGKDGIPRLGDRPARTVHGITPGGGFSGAPPGIAQWETVLKGKDFFPARRRRGQEEAGVADERDLGPEDAVCRL